MRNTRVRLLSDRPASYRSHGLPPVPASCARPPSSAPIAAGSPRAPVRKWRESASRCRHGTVRGPGRKDLIVVGQGKGLAQEHLAVLASQQIVEAHEVRAREADEGA